MSKALLLFDYQGIKKVISGGQDGVDLGGLMAAKGLGLPTGGTAPRGFRTTHGDDPTLGTEYGLTEHTSRDYPPRTKSNVVNSDGTLIIATNIYSSGTALTIRLCLEAKRPFYVVDLKRSTVDEVARPIADWLRENLIETLNVAGNHENPDYHQKITANIIEQVYAIISPDHRLGNIS